MIVLKLMTDLNDLVDTSFPLKKKRKIISLKDENNRGKFRIIVNKQMFDCPVHFEISFKSHVTNIKEENSMNLRCRSFVQFINTEPSSFHNCTFLFTQYFSLLWIKPTLYVEFHTTDYDIIQLLYALILDV